MGMHEATAPLDHARPPEQRLSTRNVSYLNGDIKTFRVNVRTSARPRNKATKGWKIFSDSYITIFKTK